MPITRRTLVGGAALTTLTSPAAAVHLRRRRSDDVRVAVVGVRGRGGNHIDGLQRLDGVDVVALCDVDQNVLADKARKFEEKHQQSVRTYVDIREVLQQEDIHAVSMATPNHLHALHTIWACQAGKDVYVEKPVSHNVREGRLAVKAARKYRRVVQAGTQSRSSHGMRDAIRWLHEGNLGAITHAWGTCFKPRNSIGKVDTPQEVPGHVDWELYMGPRGNQPLKRRQLHYDWHWQFATGNGDLGNQGIHQVDQCRWGLGRKQLAPRVFSVGGRFGYDDDGDTPNTQFVYFDYQPAPMIFEVRGLPKAKEFQQKGWGGNMDRRLGSGIGANIHAEGGRLLIPNYNSAVAYDNEGKEIQKWQGSSSHFANFIEAVRAQDPSVLNADLEEGHISSGLCHMGNDSLMLGHRASRAAIQDEVTDNALTAEAFDRFCTHLDANGVDPEQYPARLGRWLVLDQETERYCGADEATQARWHGSYVEGFEVPDEV